MAGEGDFTMALVEMVTCEGCLVVCSTEKKHSTGGQALGFFSSRSPGLKTFGNHSNSCRASVNPVKDAKSFQKDPILAGEDKKEI